MFSLGHWLWLGIFGAMIVLGLFLCFRYKPSIGRVLSNCCVIAVISECVKLFSSIELQPIVDMMISNASDTPRIIYQGTGAFVPYLERRHLPFELCSLQIFFIFAARFMKAGERKNILLTFMYLTEVIGGTFARLLPGFLLEEKYDSV